MEQNKLTFPFLLIGIFVIGVFLMTISFTEVLETNSKDLFTLSIFTIEFVICLFGILFYLKTDKFSDIFLGQIFSNPGKIFVWTNATWLFIIIAFIFDELINSSSIELSFYIPFLSYYFILSIVVNFFIVIFYTNFDDDDCYNGYSLLNYFSISLAILLILFFSLMMLFCVTINYPSISICFFMFIVYLINIISKILKLKIN